jgi:hypothetical protein
MYDAGQLPSWSSSLLPGRRRSSLLLTAVASFLLQLFVQVDVCRSSTTPTTVARRTDFGSGSGSGDTIAGLRRTNRAYCSTTTTATFAFLHKDGGEGRVGGVSHGRRCWTMIPSTRCVFLSLTTTTTKPTPTTESTSAETSTSTTNTATSFSTTSITSEEYQRRLAATLEVLRLKDEASPKLSKEVCERVRVRVRVCS